MIAICPECQGRKFTIASHVRYADGSGRSNVTLKCSFCQGTGEVPQEKLAWRAQGQAMREDRVNVRMVGLREEAKQRGMSPSELSGMEQGRIKPVPAHDPLCCCHDCLPESVHKGK